MIRDYFDAFGIFNPEELADLETFFEYRKLDKQACFTREGETCREVAFVVSGVFRSFYTSQEGVDYTYCFRFPGDWIAAYSSFITGQPGQETLQALTEAEIWVIRKDKTETLTRKNPKWERFFRLIAEQQYLELEKRIFQLQKNNAAKKYKELLQNQAELVQKIPLQYLASYLGITPRHLSRIRKGITF
jgi:cAMP-binding proteins - catabolite gene activator and regulatory subunit of cAMP-dependent protein kinases